ncbi:hypothetical protein FNO01nite_21160 [Flavobacterium noncentrifugens]|uniref:Peptidoglycan/LPS O-acetylase OafA/YrhL, contains acyltransferase and SGNH-hydrolase domains n=1 Tax=Flavobacterium noncentrifugens TaxID=1128970 RepID=A0A1G9AGT2_9FLAO|nr:acyltransferase family protein [Flavobacterium noncentrifugens]GEP51444.1 hypothetical protein FNO01nite_21160 [Flavobacterium noncentrifugens]SDK26569.1 Peptidoglycan/LPS O-acetylase OafA/YrhL, contains acyltransferase and SGNH-hydrolase domains [Flavobacterium noncentrifugens]
MTKYRPEIDGLRAVAVVAVVLFHLNSDFLIGGYYGVDVFFVISGYLITGIIVKDLENDTFKMSKFWIRRVKRLVPLLLTVVIITILVLPFFTFKPIYNDILKDIIPAVFSYFNFHAYFNFGDYWGPAADKSFFLHTWSLSVEEQFYLFYPLLLIIIKKYFKSFLKPLIFITLISLGLFVCFVKFKTHLTFYMLPFRFWELSAGGVIACLPKKSTLNKIYNTVFPIIGLLLIFISYFFAEKTISYIVVLPVVGTALIIYFISVNDITGKLLSSSIFVHIGKLSYSLYLWHWPIIVLFKNLEFRFLGVNEWYIYLFIIIATYLLSVLSFKWIETKTRNYRNTPKLVLLGVGLCLALIAYYKSPYFNIHYPSLYNQQTYYLQQYDVSPTQVILKKGNPLIYNVTVLNRSSADNDAFKKQGILKRINDKNPEILVLGDSHGAMWAKTLEEACGELKISSSVYTTNASKPFFNLHDLDDQASNEFFTKKERIDFAKSIVSNIHKWKIKMVVISCRWEALSDDNRSEFENLMVYLKDKNIKMLVINQPPRISIVNNLNVSQYVSYLKIDPKNGFHTISLSQDKVIKGNQFVAQLAKKYSNVMVFDVFSRLYNKDQMKITHNKDVLYFDDDHLSDSGTRFFKQDLKKTMTKELD